MHPGQNVTVEEGSSLGGFRAKPNAPNHPSCDLGGGPMTGPSTGPSGPLQLLDPLGEKVKRMLRRNDQAHEQLIHLIHRRCDP